MTHPLRSRPSIQSHFDLIQRQTGVKQNQLDAADQTLHLRQRRRISWEYYSWTDTYKPRSNSGRSWKCLKCRHQYQKAQSR